MNIDILTTFPEMFENVMHMSILGRAQEKGLIQVNAVDIRPFSLSKHKNTDDYPFGGGAGMLMMPQPIKDAMLSVTKDKENVKRIFMGPRGVPLTQDLAKELSKEEHLVILCGHYEGVDQRILDNYIDMEVSLGDYVLTGGEVAAMVLVDCVSRLVKGVLGSEESPQDESFSDDLLLEYPQYTRPRVFDDIEVPAVLLNGDHKKIAQYRREESLLVTAKSRPDLIQKAMAQGKISQKEQAFLISKGFSLENL